METPTKKRKGDAASGAVITLDESHGQSKFQLDKKTWLT